MIGTAEQTVKPEASPEPTIDLARLRRALFLDVAPAGYSRRYEVSGGTRVYLVDLDDVSGPCGCPDAEIRRVVCKHQMAVLLREGDPALLVALRQLVTPASCAHPA